MKPINIEEVREHYAKEKCCEECLGVDDNSGDGIGLATEYCSNPDCPCHTTPDTEADVQESMKASMTDWKDLTPEQKREIGLTAAKEANAAQRKIATTV